MNFALPALLVFLISLPGLILRYTYAKGIFILERRRPVTFRATTEEIALSIPFAALLHLI
jgi:hypothetical protein